jgi:hypothetical protein
LEAVEEAAFAEARTGFQTVTTTVTAVSAAAAAASAIAAAPATVTDPFRLLAFPIEINTGAVVTVMVVVDG